jgi:RecB family endonuclease NucS
MPLTENQVSEVERLLREHPDWDAHRIAEELGVPFMAVAGVKAHLAKVRNEELIEEEELLEEAITGKFGLERDLQKALRDNIGQLEVGMKVIDEDTEQSVPSGRIDITAEDNHGTTVVIELKAGTADHHAISQILSYMGDLIAKGKQVRGILVAGDFSLRAIAAARAVPSIGLRQYAFQFSFKLIK